MYKLAKPIRCPNCGEIVQVDTSMILTSYPPQYKWECPKCGRTGTVGSKDDIITFENQIGLVTSGDIQKVGKLDPSISVIPMNATGDGYNTINAVPSICSPMTECEICGEEFKFDSRSYICPKCREAIVKLRGTADSTANAMPTDKSTANAMPADNKSTATDSKSTACDIPAPKFIQQGWQCPKCGAVLAPNQSYCPFCSPSEYGRSNWVVTTPVRVPLEQYTNPNPSTSISLGDKLKVTDSCTHTSATHCDNIKATL